MQIIAIDTGGTKIVGSAVNEAGEILKEIRIENTGRTGAFIVESYIRIIKEILKEYEIDAIGIGAGGRIDENTGVVLYAVGIFQDYIGLNIKKSLEERFHKPVFVTNDCRAALIGEHWLGSVQDYQQIFGIILGTGVGGGLLADGKLQDGARGGFGEAGHMILHHNGRQCTCGQSGCVEQYISGTALWSIYNDTIGGEEIHSGYEFFEKVRKQEKAARTVLAGFVDDLSDTLISCANLLDPEIIVIGGGLIDTAGYWWEDLQEQYQEKTNRHTKTIKIVKAQKGNKAAIVGTAKYAMDHLK